MRKDLAHIQLNAIEKYVIASLLLIHLLVACTIGLSPDEAHYALYASYLDWSYYDHPPMVGWAQYAFLRWSPSELSLRMVPMASWALTLFLLLKWGVKIRTLNQTYEIVANHANGERAQRGVRLEILLFGASPMLHLLSVALVPDTLLMPLVLILMFTTWNLIEFADYSSSPWWSWIQLGGVLGIAGLTKYTAVIFVIPVGILLLQKFGWKLLYRSKFWLACAIAFLLITPVLWWNHQHEWISFSYQFNHATGSSEWLIRKCIVFVLVIVIAFGPLMFVGLWLDRKNITAQRKSIVYFFFLFSIPFLAFLVFLSGRGSTLPHWAAPAVVALIPLTVLQLSEFKRGFNRLFKLLLGFQILSAMGLGALLLTAGFGEEIDEQKIANSQTHIHYAKNNPFADLYGWDAAGERAKILLEKNKIDKIVLSNWTLASRLAWYARPSPVNLVDKRQDQFAIWFGTLKENDSALWVNWSMMPFDFPVSKDQFESCEPIDQLPIIHQGRQIAHFNFAICKGWQMRE
jgi:Dolichyl-phosphate-mannose-protein mannosyltransferase